MIYHLHAVFESLQGEGRNMGRPAVFVRFSSCNLMCPWCDTHREERMAISEDELLALVKKTGKRSVILTGGEPTIQPGFDQLVSILKNNGFWVALETNGVRAPLYPDRLDYIAVSPKPDFEEQYHGNVMLKRADEVRIVAVNDKIAPFCRRMRETISATDYYISPLFSGGRAHYRRAFKVLHVLNHADPAPFPPWSLSMQMHKILGIR
jgi:organic radical activating enzyme